MRRQIEAKRSRSGREEAMLKRSIVHDPNASVPPERYRAGFEHAVAPSHDDFPAKRGQRSHPRHGNQIDHERVGGAGGVIRHRAAQQRHA